MTVNTENILHARTKYQRQLDSSRWLTTRKRIIDRSCGICERCGSKPKTLEIHHLEYHGDHPSDTVDNLLIALCSDCHDFVHWQDRLKAYSAKKRELIDAGAPYIEIEKLVDEYEV